MKSARQHPPARRLWRRPQRTVRRAGQVWIYFTRTTSPSEDDEFHPERGAWEAYKLDSLYALGWFKGEDGGFITGTNKPDKRRQLGVQRLAAPVGAEALMRTGRLTGDRMLNTTAVFLENYPFSEGSGVVDPTLVQGFTDFRPRTVERPTRAGEDWKVRFGIEDEPGPLGAAGEERLPGRAVRGWRVAAAGAGEGHPWRAAAPVRLAQDDSQATRP